LIKAILELKENIFSLSPIFFKGIEIFIPRIERESIIYGKNNPENSKNENGNTEREKIENLSLDNIV
jgi:hypothetical protein